ncbi:Exosortase [Desulfonema limicola]|uniref:Exosortase n=1 Tax=Desulfonema limicola TaxID=45656 RepID=A0A975B5F8_9BACT|nr:exosortase/archaeosortase family protein [Desulfonema limicola]QTA79113.1 Exosortase [Desulfonema limicola]
MSILNHKFKKSWLSWLLLMLIIAVYAPTVLWLFDRWTMSVWHNGHSILIAPLVVYLIWNELKKHRSLPVIADGLGFFILIPALIIHILDTGIHSMLLSAFSLFLALPGLSLLFIGRERSKAIIFPLIMFFLTLPIPLFLTESIHLILRQVSTYGTVFMLRFFGIPVFVQGTTLEIPNGVLQVAYACSGFSTLYASVTIAFLVAYFCPDKQRRILVLIIAAPLAIGVNIIRIFLLCLMVYWMGVDILKTSLHEISGLLTFVIAIPLIFLIGQPPAKSK